MHLRPGQLSALRSLAAQAGVELRAGTVRLYGCEPDALTAEQGDATERLLRERLAAVEPVEAPEAPDEPEAPEAPERVPWGPEVRHVARYPREVLGLDEAGRHAWCLAREAELRKGA